MKRKTTGRDWRNNYTEEVLKHDSVFKIEELKEADVDHCVNLYCTLVWFWPQAYKSILKVQIAIFSPFGIVQFLFKDKHLLCD